MLGKILSIFIETINIKKFSHQRQSFQFVNQIVIFFVLVYDVEEKDDSDDNDDDVDDDEYDDLPPAFVQKKGSYQFLTSGMLCETHCSNVSMALSVK